MCLASKEALAFAELKDVMHSVTQSSTQNRTKNLLATVEQTLCGERVPQTGSSMSTKKCMPLPARMLFQRRS